MKTSPITNSLKSLQKSEPEEEQLELNCEVGVCQQVMQRIEIPAGQNKHYLDQIVQESRKYPDFKRTYIFKDHHGSYQE